MKKSALTHHPPRPRRSPGRAGATPRLGTRGQPEESRAAILKAAVTEFAEHGIAGARTDAIARAAHVNKALLYYYFEDKEALYEAVLDQVFSGLRARVMPVLESKLPPRQKMLEYLGAYFDYIAANPRFPRVVQAEWMRSGAGRAPMQRGGKEYFGAAPLMKTLLKVDPLSVERIRERRAFVLDFISAALFAR